jgi:Ubiquitin family
MATNAESSADFIEFPLINPAGYDWRTNSKDFPSDLTIVVENGSAPSVTYSVHLRILSMLSDVCYRISSRPMDAIVSYFTGFDQCASCDGDVTVRLQDGSTFTIGSLAQPVSVLKEKMEELQGIPACDQRLFFLQEAGGTEIELSEDWRTLAGCGVKIETLG